MASIFQPILNQPNVNPYIAPGVEDKSEATRIAGQTELIKDVADIGKEVYAGYQESDLEKSIQREAETFNISQTAEQEAATEVVAQRSAIESYWGNMDANIETANAMEKQFQDKLARYKSAKEQGTMSVDELQSRILSLTRQSINQNPWMADRIRKTADSYLEASGIGSFIKAAKKSEEQTATTQRQQQEFVFKEMVEAGINPLDPTGFAQLIIRNQQINNYELALKDMQVNKERATQYFNNPTIFNNITESSITALNAKLAAIRNNTQLTPDEKVLQMEQVGTLHVSEYRSMFRDNAGSPQVSSTVEGMQRLLVANRDAVTQKLTKEQQSNRVAIAEDAAKLKLNAFEEGAALNIMKGLPDSFVASFTAQGKGKEKLTSIANSVIAKGFGNLNPTADQPVVKATFTEAVRQAKENNDPKALNGLFSSFHQTMVDPKKSAKDKAAWGDTFVTNLAQGANFNTIDVNVRAQAIEDVKTYLEQAISFSRTKTHFSDNSPIRMPKDVKLSALRDGTLIFESLSDKVTENKLNQEFGQRINLAIHALAHLEGTTDYKKALRETKIADVVGKLYSVGVSEQPTPITVGKSMETLESFLARQSQVPKQVQQARDNQRLQILYAEREDQRTAGQIDSALEKEIAIEEKKQGIK